MKYNDRIRDTGASQQAISGYDGHDCASNVKCKIHHVAHVKREIRVYHSRL